MAVSLQHAIDGCRLKDSEALAQRLLLTLELARARASAARACASASAARASAAFALSAAGERPSARPAAAAAWRALRLFVE
eukprot:3826951-Prymnesium_polylepis.1